jgi:predicted CXXCH cytochrome family protein
VKVRWFTLLAITLAILGMMALLAATASADGGVHNFSSTSVTSNCAGCHRAHTAIGSNLLKATSAYALCTSCHGVGAGVDVIDGYAGTGPTRGSGFSYSWMNSGWITTTLPVTYTAVTSKHWVVGDPSYTGTVTQTTVWGLGALNSGAGSTFALQCSTCHDPHGKSGPGGTPTYRILRSDFSTTGPSGATGFNVPDTVSHTYTINDLTYYVYYGQNYSSVNDKTGTDNANMAALNNWCGSCHTRIHTSDNLNTGALGPGQTSSGDSIFTYRHITTGSSIELNFWTSNKTPSGPPGCLTCHVSHGSPAALTSSSAKNVPWPGGTEGSNAPYGSYQDSELMRLNQRGVCEACHNK